MTDETKCLSAEEQKWVELGYNPVKRREPIFGIGNSKLHNLILLGQYKMVASAIKNGADVNAQNHAGETPLHYALFYGEVEMATLIIKKLGGDDVFDEEIQLTEMEIKETETKLEILKKKHQSLKDFSSIK